MTRMAIELLDSANVVDTSQACIGKKAAVPTTDVLGRIANLETRLARTASEIDAAQAVRYRVFVEEMKASGSIAWLISLSCRRSASRSA